MIHPPSLLLGGLIVAALAASGNAIAAQDDCPEEQICVDLSETQVVEIDPSLGFLQSIVIEERELTITDFDGTTTEQQVKLATFVENGDTYKLEREDIEPQDGIFANAQLGDVFVLRKAQ